MRLLLLDVHNLEWRFRCFLFLVLTLGLSSLAGIAFDGGRPAGLGEHLFNRVRQILTVKPDLEALGENRSLGKDTGNNTQTTTALLRKEISVDTLETNSLCCEAAGIIAPSSSTTDALIPHEKLREAATPNATLIAQNRPPGQIIQGYKRPSLEAA